MKRELLENVKVLPVTSGSTVIDRAGFLSAVLGVTATGATTVTVAHCDTEDGTFEPVKDTRLFGDGTKVADDGSVSAVIPTEADDLLNVGIDLVGCKQFIQFTAAGAFALALGDSIAQPV
ncbi:MAG: hypothetical protein LBJ11_09080 [Oscillospiraceae bacterium]|jgi:hypothetical protein|nr:hypothetical protein [Oscillospiraceae bacterium]